MKSVFSLSILIAKTLMLLCISGGGFLEMVEASPAAVVPCHQEVVGEAKPQGSCDMCIPAIDSLTQHATFEATNSILDDGEGVAHVEAVYVNIFIKEFKTVYQTYDPPPEVQFKSVSPITKTTVLIV